MTLVYPHRIRLRGPWECEPLVSLRPGEALPPPRRMTMPCRWGEGGLGEFAGRVRFRRRFGYPGRLDPEERVWLTFAGVSGAAEVWLNGQFLGRQPDHAGPFAYEVTALLRPRNELVVVVEATTPAGGLWGEVALEIRRTAYLHRLRAWQETGPPGRVHLTGELCGSAAHPLDIYILWRGKRLLSATLVPQPPGQSFHLISEPLPPLEVSTHSLAEQGASVPDLQAASLQPSECVQVELVGGSLLWDQQTVPLEKMPADSS